MNADALAETLRGGQVCYWSALARRAMAKG